MKNKTFFRPNGNKGFPNGKTGDSEIFGSEQEQEDIIAN